MIGPVHDLSANLLQGSTMHDPCHCAMRMGTVLFSALIIVLMNLIIDISYGFLDPRVRYK